MYKHYIPELLSKTPECITPLFFINVLIFISIVIVFIILCS